jgi:hypothetical protein
MSIPTVLRPDRDRMTFSFVNPWVHPPAEPRIRGTVVFRTDERAGGKAESFLDLIEEHRLGVIVGSPQPAPTATTIPCWCRAGTG